jgi:hypothetical protein
MSQTRMSQTRMSQTRMSQTCMSQTRMSQTRMPQPKPRNVQYVPNMPLMVHNITGYQTQNLK